MKPNHPIHVARNGEHLGTWPKYAIRHLFLTGELIASDHILPDGEEAWHRLVPDPPVHAEEYPYEDGPPMFYVHEGHLFGPRSFDEINALLSAGYLEDDDLIAPLGAPHWFTVKELTADASQTAPPRPAERDDWLETGLNVLDHVSPLTSGTIRALRKWAHEPD